jgi:hypothetical protein
MTKFKYILSIISILIFFSYSTDIAQDSEFKISENEKTPSGIVLKPHSEFLGLGLRYPVSEVVPFWKRMPFLDTPGDYYLYPEGADSTTLSETELSEVANTLNYLIKNDYFDSFVLDNLTGFYYEMMEGKVKRKEYYVKYSRGDTIHVISGLLGKFFSFYRAIPTIEKPSITKLISEISRLSTIDKAPNKNHFVEKENKHVCFIEYTDRDHKVRFRNYQIVENWNNTDVERDNPYGEYYNLIEITKFLDEDAIP